VTGPAAIPAARDRLIEGHLPLVRALARRYAGSGEPVEDLVQVGAIGLIKAVDRYDPARGAALEHYAAALIAGEIRHHLRDCGGAVRVPRTLREQGLRLRYEPLAGDPAAAPGTTAAAADPVAAADDRLTLAHATRALHPRARRLLALCFERDLSQAQAAAALGISPAQASRQMHDALRTLRGALSEPPPPTGREAAVAVASRGG
jgi:RNA polymerase sigma-B factor